MVKTQTAWVIMRDDEKFLIYYSWLEEDFTYCEDIRDVREWFENKEDCIKYLEENWELKNCKPIRITISVEED